MKINVIVGGLNIVKDGYPNVYLDTPQFDELICNNECEEIFVSILEYTNPKESLEKTLQKIISKLRLHGHVFIEFTDMYEVCKAVMVGNIEVKDLVQYTFGKLRFTSLIEVSNILNKIGLKVIHKRINTTNCIIEAIREN